MHVPAFAVGALVVSLLLDLPLFWALVAVLGAGLLSGAVGGL